MSGSIIPDTLRAPCTLQVWFITLDPNPYG